VVVAVVVVVIVVVVVDAVRLNRYCCNAEGFYCGNLYKAEIL